MLVANISARIVAYMSTRVAREEGQALVEYALIISFIAVAAVAILRTMGTTVAGLFTQISNGL